MNVLAGTLGHIALYMQLYLANPMGEEYWTECDKAGDAMQGVVEQTFLTACTNYRISKIPWQVAHVSENWQAFFGSQVMHSPLTGF